MLPIYIFIDLPSELVEELSCVVPIISGENTTIVFMSDFDDLDDEFRTVIEMECGSMKTIK